MTMAQFQFPKFPVISNNDPQLKWYLEEAKRQGVSLGIDYSNSVTPWSELFGRLHGGLDTE